VGLLVSRTKTIQKHVACGHEIRVRSWGSSEPVPRVDLQLDGVCLVVTGREHLGLLEAIARNLAYALRAPERRKKTTRLEIETTPEGAERLRSLVGEKLAGIRVLAVEPEPKR
jgi:hypothetical protein